MIRPAYKPKYDIRQSGHPALHEELEWYVNGDETVLGVLIRDKIDLDFSWVVLMEVKDQGPGFTAIDLEASVATKRAARDALFTAMKKYF